ncbi:MAG: response regulator [Cyclobacteriaceae bacterium]|nr:response regulator [Cyclobacteriaceae bacterium]
MLKGVKGKVIAAFVLASVAIISALAITKYSFEGLLGTVNSLAQPNEKLRALNNLYQKVIQLDQLQRADAIRRPHKSAEALLHESEPIILTLDTLRRMRWSGQEQLARLDEMEKLVRERERLLFSYFTLKSDFILNAKFSRQLDSLAAIITWSQANRDTSVTTTERRTVTTTYPTAAEVEDNRSWLEKLFSSKKPSATNPETRFEVQEEFNVRIDTIYTAQQDSAIAEVGRIMKAIEDDHRLQSQQVARRELDLVNANTRLINELVSHIREVEREERAIEKANSDMALSLTTKSVTRIGIILIISFLGSALLVFLILTDISKSNTLRKQLVEAKERAEELSHVKQRFLANMSHEIRTPLQSILGFSEQLRQQHTADPEAVEAIHSSSEHLLHIVNEVLDFSKIESGKLTIERDPFDLGTVLKEVEAAIRVQAAKKGLDFVLTYDPSWDIPLIGDSFRLRQILYNLLGNAVKFTLKGRVGLQVDIEEQDYGVNCTFSVSDTGLGMTEEEIGNVFNQFEQAHATIDRQFGGTGLGLTIVKRLVEAQNGHLTVESTPGEGSLFIVKLHFDKASHDAVSVRKEYAGEAETQPVGKVLVVDDDPMILRLCRIILEKYRIPHEAHGDPLEVLEAPLDPDINFILLDIRLPGISGVELCRELRRKTGSDTKIVALTAHVLPQEKHQLIESGFDYVLTKPFREKDLLQQLGITTHATPARAPEEGKPDLHILRQMTMGDAELYQTVLQQFLQETQEDSDKLEEEMKHLEYAHIRERIHKLAGRIGQVGVERLSEKLRKIEDDIVEGKSIQQLADRIYAAIGEVKALVQQVREEELVRPST